MRRLLGFVIEHGDIDGLLAFYHLTLQDLVLLNVHQVLFISQLEQ